MHRVVIDLSNRKPGEKVKGQRVELTADEEKAITDVWTANDAIVKPTARDEAAARLDGDKLLAALLAELAAARGSDADKVKADILSRIEP